MPDGMTSAALFGDALLLALEVVLVGNISLTVLIGRGEDLLLDLETVSDGMTSAALFGEALLPAPEVVLVGMRATPPSSRSIVGRKILICERTELLLDILIG